MKVLGVIILGIFLTGALVAGCIAVVNDENSLARIVVASHDYGGDCDRDDCGGQEYDQNNGSRDDRNRNRDRNRGAFSPGPFDRSPVDAFNNVCMPGATCHYDGQRDQRSGQDGEPQ